MNGYITYLESLISFIKQLGLVTELNEDVDGFVTLINIKSLPIKIDYNNIKDEIITVNDIFYNYCNKYYKGNKYFKALKNNKYYFNVFYKHDEAFLMVFSINETELKVFINCINKIQSSKYKANFTQEERKLIYKLKNGLCKERYSYNFDYLSNIEDKILLLSSELEEIEEERIKNIKEYKSIIKMFNNSLLSHELSQVTRVLKLIDGNYKSMIFIEDEKFRIAEELNKTKKLYDELTYSYKE